MKLWASTPSVLSQAAIAIRDYYLNPKNKGMLTIKQKQSADEFFPYQREHEQTVNVVIMERIYVTEAVYWKDGQHRQVPEQQCAW